MKISFLNMGGGTGGPVNSYRFMDELCKRGHEVYSVSPAEAIRWEVGYSDKVTAEFWATTPRKAAKRPGKVADALPAAQRPTRQTLGRGYRLAYKLGTKALKRTPRLAKEVSSILNADYIFGHGNVDLFRAMQDTRLITAGLLSNWVPSDVTVAASYFTAYAAYGLMDRTVPLYYIQHYEELFSPNEALQKVARLTYFMPLYLVSGGAWQREQIRKRCGRDAPILNPGFDHRIFYPMRDTREKYANARPLKVVTYVRDEPWKAWPETVEAMRMVNAALGRDAVEWNAYYFLTHPPSPDDVRVNFVEDTYRDLPHLFSDSHISLQFCWYAGFPGAILEPMACGTAVVASGLGVEELAVDGQNSLVVPPRDSRAMADAIIRLARDPKLAQSLVEKGIETARRFTWEEAGENFEEVIRMAVRDYPFAGAFSDIPDLISGKLS